jgi:hypothetical protein
MSRRTAPRTYRKDDRDFDELDRRLADLRASQYCRQPLYRDGEHVAVCVSTRGTEHDHDAALKGLSLS